MADIPSGERFNALYDHNAQDILTYLLRRTTTPEDAADCLAETFLIAWDKREQIPADARHAHGVGFADPARSREGSQAFSQCRARPCPPRPDETAPPTRRRKHTSRNDVDSRTLATRGLERPLPRAKKAGSRRGLSANVIQRVERAPQRRSVGRPTAGPCPIP